MSHTSKTYRQAIILVYAHAVLDNRSARCRDVEAIGVVTQEIASS